MMVVFGLDFVIGDLFPGTASEASAARNSSKNPDAMPVV